VSTIDQRSDVLTPVSRGTSGQEYGDVRPRSTYISFLIVGLALATASAQEASIRQVDNPYQEDLPYRIGSDLVPGIEVEGVRWERVSVATKDGGTPEAGSDHPVVVELEFNNQQRAGVDLTVVLLLEDESGGELQRLACPEYRLGGNKTKVFRPKFSVSGDDLLATRNMYVFCRVE